MADQIPPYTPPPIPKSNDNSDKDEIIKQLKAQLEEERTNNEAIGTTVCYFFIRIIIHYIFFCSKKCCRTCETFRR